MSHDPWRTGLRMAVINHDCATIVGILRAEHPDDWLQVAGDAILIALASEEPGALELARLCVDALRARDWMGDDLLADDLDAALRGEALPLVQVPVDLEELASVIDGRFGEHGYLDMQTGEVWPQVAVEYSLEMGEEDVDFEDESRWLSVEGHGARDAYGDMIAFIETIGDRRLVDDLEQTLHGKGAFRHFRAALERFPEELTRWHRFSEDARVGRARAHLAGEGYRPGAVPRARA